MAYDALHQKDRDERSEDYHSVSSSPLQRLASPNSAPLSLFLDHGENTRRHEDSPGTGTFSGLLDSIASKPTRSSTSYDLVEAEEYEEEGGRKSPVLSLSISKHLGGSSTESFVPLNISRPRPSRPRLRTQAPATSAEERGLASKPPEPILRSASGRDLTLRHPTPDLQVLQGAYMGNIEHLERTAERLSMTSSIDDAIRELHLEQKRIDSRRSSLLSSPELPSVTTEVSNASSIVETNNLARSGGYSPAGFMMSPKGSLTTGGIHRSASKSSRFGSRPEPELEGRPLESFANTSSEMPPVLSRAASIAEQNENSTTLTRPVLDLIDSNLDLDLQMPQTRDGPEEEERPTTSASINTFDQAEQAFADFDGVHSAPPQRSMSENESSNEAAEMAQRRISSLGRMSVAGSDAGSQRGASNDRMSMIQPQSYADPSTGQQMVYYPAPVPMMLNLPQKLSKTPSSMARNKRRSQVLSSIPQAARQSAIWLPDVLETEDEPNNMAEDDGEHQMYVAQHQRATMGGRRLTQDLQHLPPQLRANAFFDIPGPNQMVELKEQSAVATLDSILDASAFAPVSAFTDHAFAGHLGHEVYGRPALRNSRSSTQLLTEEKSKKRVSSFNLLRGRRASSSELPGSENEKKRQNTLADIRDGKILRDDDDDDDGMALEDYEGELEDEDDEEDEEVYQGAPTTLLAELQLRKQQQKHRTRPLGNAFPNGMHSTLLELDSVAQVEQKTRQQKRVQLAWEDPSVQEAEDAMAGGDEDVPLALLYAKKSQIQEPNRPMGLMERRDMEDNEPLSRRRDRLQGRPLTNKRASTMMDIPRNLTPEEGETVTQQAQRLNDTGRSSTGLPSARPVSGDFASEMMSQFGGDLDPKGKGKETSTSPAPEEEETLGQRRKRLQAEKEARAKEVGNLGDAQRQPLTKRRSMADILSAHPAAGASADRVISYGKAPAGLLGWHEKASARRSSTMMNLTQQTPAGGFRAGMYNDGQGGIIPPPRPQPQPQLQQRNSSYNMYNQPGAMFPQPSLGYGYGPGNQVMMPFANPYVTPMGYPNPNGMPMGYSMPNINMGMGMMGMGVEPLNQGQIDMVERWRQSVMQ
jgi:hypothetical protein